MRGRKETLMKFRILLVLCCVLLPAASGFAQSTPEKTPDVSTELRNGFNEVNDWVTKAAEMVPAEKYNYRPVDTVRTFGQLIAHSLILTTFSAHAARATKSSGLMQSRRARLTKTRCFPNSKKLSESVTPPTAPATASFDHYLPTWATRVFTTATSSRTCG